MCVSYLYGHSLISCCRHNCLHRSGTALYPQRYRLASVTCPPSFSSFRPCCRGEGVCQEPNGSSKKIITLLTPHTLFFFSQYCSRCMTTLETNMSKAGLRDDDWFGLLGYGLVPHKYPRVDAETNRKHKLADRWILSPLS